MILQVPAVLLFVVQYFKEDTQCMYKRNILARSCRHCCRGQTIGGTYSEFVSVALIIQHAKRMRRIILSSVACPDLPYFFRIIS